MYMANTCTLFWGVPDSIVFICSTGADADAMIKIITFYSISLAIDAFFELFVGKKPYVFIFFSNILASAIQSCIIWSDSKKRVLYTIARKCIRFFFESDVIKLRNM